MKIVWGVSLIAAAALGAECGYDGKEFWVRDESGVHRQSVASNYNGPSVACGSRVSAIYDGGEFTVFEAGLGRFSWRKAANGFRPGPVAVSGPLAGLYDGDQFFVYDAARDSFATAKAWPNFYYASLVAADNSLVLYDGESLQVYAAARGGFIKEPAGRKIANHRLQTGGRLTVLYDGGELLVYDSRKGGIARQGVSPTNFSTLAIGTRGILFYDGKKLVGYCAEARGFVAAPMPFDAFSTGMLDKVSGRPVVRVESKSYRLDPAACRIETL